MLLSSVGAKKQRSYQLIDLADNSVLCRSSGKASGAAWSQQSVYPRAAAVYRLVYVADCGDSVVLKSGNQCSAIRLVDADNRVVFVVVRQVPERAEQALERRRLDVAVRRQTSVVGDDRAGACRCCERIAATATGAALDKRWPRQQLELMDFDRRHARLWFVTDWARRNHRHRLLYSTHYCCLSTHLV